mmetsp:Transcript_12695/g.18512  ORF Transcript_12695/g.18512 Transcript_12695/m.18512 type:complete len:229 (-) Transcript_12695:162-848(-)
MACVVNFGDGQAFDVIAAPGKQADDTRENAGFVFHQNRQRVLFLHIRKGRAQVIGGMAGGAFFDMEGRHVCPFLKFGPKFGAGRIRPANSVPALGLDHDRAACLDDALGVGLAHQHFVVGLARWDHREAVFVLFHQAVKDHRSIVGDHLHYGVIQICRIRAQDPLGAKSFGQLDKIGQRFRPGVAVAFPMQQFLPLAHHAKALVVEDELLHRQTVLGGCAHLLHVHQP